MSSPVTACDARRTALVGAGRIAAIHVQAVREQGQAEVVAVCDLHQAAADAFAAKHGIAGAYSDLRRMMEEARPDVVHLLTPPRSHRALAEVIAPHGAHLYVEKPLASNEADARAILDIAARAGVRVCVGHNRLFDPQFLEMTRRIRAGAIGRVVSVRAEQGFAYEAVARAAAIPWSYTYDWGIFENLAPHPLYLVSHFLADPGEPRVAGFSLGRIREAGVEELRILIPSREAVGEVVLSMTTAPVANRIEVVGTRGRMTADYVSLHLVQTLRSPLPGAITRITSNLGLAAQLAAGSFKFAFGVLSGRIKQYQGMRTLVGEFYRALRTGAELPVRPEDGLLNVRQMDAVRAASRDILKSRSPEPASTPLAQPRPGPVSLVTGATGFLGGRVVERLAADGVAVRATTRLASRARPIDGVEWVSCNLSNEEELRRALAGVETVYHCAAMAGAPGSLEDYEESNVRGTLRVARLAVEAGVKTLVYVSSISVYAIPPRSGRYLDESAAYDARAAERGFYTQSKLGADRALIELARSHPSIRILLLRPGTIWGPGVKLPIGRFGLPSPWAARPLVAGSGGVPMPLVHVDNVIDAMKLAARSPVPSGSVFNIVDDAECNQAAIARTLRDVSGGRLRPIGLPYPLVWSLMLAVDLLSLARKGQIGTARYRLKRTLADMRYRSEAARRDLGWSPKVSLADGLSQVLESEREKPYPH